MGLLAHIWIVCGALYCLSIWGNLDSCEFRVENTNVIYVRVITGWNLLKQFHQITFCVYIWNREMIISHHLSRDTRDRGSIPGLGRCPGEGNGTPLQYSCLENPMDRGSWWAAVHGVAKIWKRLNDWARAHIRFVDHFQHSGHYQNKNFLNKNHDC